ncbi:MAG: hypothetical protein KDJ75_08535 [Alphaproteobacteria bacterium]|nr:hypothetical protein [Alphaproteobacteria bacterium]
MVDPIKGAGFIQAILPGGKAQNTPSHAKQAEKQRETAPADEVSLSPEALSLTEAEDTAARTRTILEEQTQEALSADSTRLNELL